LPDDQREVFLLREIANLPFKEIAPPQPGQIGGLTIDVAGTLYLTAGDALEAMTLYQKRHGKIDLLMTDMGLPGKNGRQLSQDVRRTSTKIPILLTSGYVESECDREKREPNTYFLAKPYSRAELFQSLERIFGFAVGRRAASHAS
jgi:CheY-like chemotaxis protein